MGDRQPSGFTLWELMMTMAVIGVVLGVGVPNFMEFQRNAAMTAAANDLVTGTLFARSEALKLQSQEPVVLCLSRNPMAAVPTCEPQRVKDFPSLGFIVWVDKDANLDYDGAEPLLMRGPKPGPSVMVSANCAYVAYGPNGFSRKLPGMCFPTPRAILYCDERGRRTTSGATSSARVVIVDNPGRGQVLTDVATISARIGNDVMSQVDGTCP